MPTMPPPGRYRVVEKGRQLVVIDTRTGEPAARAPMSLSDEPRAGSIASAATRPERIAFDGRSTLTTKPWYDNKAPRTLELDPGATRLRESGRSGLIGGVVAWAVLALFVPWTLLPLLLLFSKGTRTALRQSATAWLDRYDPTVANRG